MQIRRLLAANLPEVAVSHKMCFTVKITILSKTAYLRILRQLLKAISGIVGEQYFTKKAVGLCSVALVEAVDNAIFHAHSECEDKPIDIMIGVDDYGITMSVTDNGSSFLVDSHMVNSYPELVAIDGRGLYLINKIMTKVEFKRVSEGNKVVMLYKLRPE